MCAKCVHTASVHQTSLWWVTERSFTTSPTIVTSHILAQSHWAGLWDGMSVSVQLSPFPAFLRVLSPLSHFFSSPSHGEKAHALHTLCARVFALLFWSLGWLNLVQFSRRFLIFIAHFSWYFSSNCSNSSVFYMISHPEVLENAVESLHLAESGNSCPLSSLPSEIRWKIVAFLPESVGQMRLVSVALII